VAAVKDRWVSAYESLEWPEGVGHGPSPHGEERRFYDLHRPFTPRWPVCVVPRPFVSEPWKSLTGHLRSFAGGAQLL